MSGLMLEHAGDALLEALLGAAVDGIVVIDEHAKILLFSRGAQSLFGYEPDQVTGQNVNILMPGHYHHEHDGYMTRYLNTGVPHIIGIGREVSALHANGEVFPIDLSVGEAPMADSALFVGIMRDLRVRTRLEDELQLERENARELERSLAHVHRVSTLGEMTAGIAHEINQPLAAISTFADAGQRLTDTESPDMDKLAYAMRNIAEQARRAGDVVQRMRDLASQTDSPRAVLPINEVLTEMLVLLQLEARDSDAPVILALDDLPTLVHVDTVAIQQVLLNLARNGLESMVTRSQAQQGITIDTSLHDAHVHVMVTDHGEGVPPAKVESIFHPFETSKPSGMGIGLSICRTIVERHGGRLWYEPNPGGGSRFIFSLPVAMETNT